MRLSLGCLSTFVLAAALQGTALAQNPHFVGDAQVGAVGTDGTISVSFKEAGLGSYVTINYSLSGSWTADYGCVNHGGKHPQASNKTASSGALAVGASLTSGKSGSISGSVPFTPPAAETVLTCPGSQFAALVDIQYWNLQLSDSSNGIDATMNTDVASATFYHF